MPVRKGSGGKVLAVCLHSQLLVLPIFIPHVTRGFGAASVGWHPTCLYRRSI